MKHSVGFLGLMAFGIGASAFALSLLRPPRTTVSSSVTASRGIDHDRAPNIPERDIVALLAGGGFDPESNQISLEDDLLEAEALFAGRARVLYAGGSGSHAVQVTRAENVPVALEQQLGELFAPRGHRESEFQRTRLAPAGPLSRAALDDQVSRFAPNAENIFLYFAGHGSATDDGGGSLFHLWGEDTPWSVKDMIDWMQAIHAQTRATQQLLVTSCFGGQFVELDGLDFACAASATTIGREASGCDPNRDRAAQQGFGVAFWTYVRTRLQRGQTSSLGSAIRAIRATASSIDVPTLSSESLLVRTLAIAEFARPVPPSSATASAMCERRWDEVAGLLNLLGHAQSVQDATGACIFFLQTDFAAMRAEVEEQIGAIDEELGQIVEPYEQERALLRAALLNEYPVLDDPWHPDYARTIRTHRKALSARLSSLHVVPSPPENLLAEQDALWVQSAVLERAEWLQNVAWAEQMTLPQNVAARVAALRACEDRPLPVTTLTP